MPSYVLTVVTLNKKSGIPADAVQNQFVFSTPTTPPTPTELGAITTAIQAFYNTANTTLSLYSYLGESVSAAVDAHRMEQYLLDGHLDGSPHGSPLRVIGWQTPFVATDQLPDEVAICLSFQHAYGSVVEFGAGGTRPRSRLRNRIYIGPLALNTLAEDSTTHEVFVTANCRTDITVAASRLRTTPGSGVVWQVWTRSSATVFTVDGGWVDNAFDTQRRRGNTATARTTFGTLV